MTVYARWQNLSPATELRVVIKCDCEGKPPYRRAAVVPTQQMQRANGEWGEELVVFDPDLPLQSRGQMRIAFELSGAGEVWLDNVRLSNLLFSQASYGNSQAECLQLSKQIHAAKSAFDAGQITDCQRMVESYWPRFILAYRPPVQVAVAERIVPKPKSALPPQTDEGQDSTPGFGDRLKRLWPITR